MITIIQGLGCVETGAEIVLRELVKATTGRRTYVAVCTVKTARDLVGRNWGRMCNGVIVIGLSHRWFGRILRPIVECMIGLLCVTRAVDSVVNLSHYGMCFGGDYVLYVHSPLLMDLEAASGWGDGRPNKLKTMMLLTCIKRCRAIILQTNQMKSQLEKFCSAKGIRPPKYIVLRPLVEICHFVRGRKQFEKQLFYPASRFAHKRVDLAIDGTQIAHACDSKIGLVLTTVPDGNAPRKGGVEYIGRINRDEVAAILASSDALLFTSERETLGLPILEALALEIPVIAPDLPYARELLGSAGCYFFENNPQSVATAISVCMADLEKWQMKARRRREEIVAESATWEDHWNYFEVPDTRESAI